MHGAGEARDDRSADGFVVGVIGFWGIFVSLRAVGFVKMHRCRSL